MLLSALALIACGQRSAAPVVPLAPLGSATEPTLAEPLEIALWNDAAAVCSAVAGLLLYDLSDPAQPRLLAQVQPSRTNGVFPRCQHVAVDAQRALLVIAARADQIQPSPYLAAFDVSDPSHPRELWSEARAEQVEGVAIAGDRVLVAAHGDGLLSFALDARGALALRDRVGGLGNAWAVRADGDTAYVADAAGSLAVIGLDDAGPALRARVALPGAPRDLALARDRIFVALGAGGVAVLSRADPAAPRLEQVVPTPGSAVAITYSEAERALVVADWDSVRLFDAQPGAPLRAVGRQPSRGVGSSPGRSFGVAARGDLLVASGWATIGTFRMHPRARVPLLEVTPARLEQARIARGAGSIALANRGSAPLDMLRIEAGPGLRVAPSPARLDPGARIELAVSLAEGTALSAESAVTIQSTDPDQPSRSIPLDATPASGVGLFERAPEWTLRAPDGVPWRLAEQTAPALLLVYFATFCPVCSHEFADLARLARDFAGRGLAIAGVDPGGILGGETPAHIAEFRQITGVRFPLLFDAGSYRAVGWPPGASPFPRQLLLGPPPERRVVYLSSTHDPVALEAALRTVLGDAAP